MPPKKLRRKYGSGSRWIRSKGSRKKRDLSAASSSSQASQGEEPDPSLSTSSQTLVPLAEEITDSSHVEPFLPQSTASFQAVTGEPNLLDGVSEVEVSDNRSVAVDHSHMETYDVEPASNEESAALTATGNITEALEQVHRKLLLSLPLYWSPFVEFSEIHVMLVSRLKPKCVQRTLSCSSDGALELSVHGVFISLDSYLQDVRPQVQLSSSSVNDFCERILEVLHNVRRMEVCAGVDKQDYHNVWNKFLHLGEVDNNSFGECRYTKTFRSLACSRLVECRKWKCEECAKLIRPLKRSHEAARMEDVPAATRNDILSEKQMLTKIQKQSERIEKQRLRLHYLEARMQSLLAAEGVNIDEDLSSDLQKILQSDKLTPAQAMFMQQQVKASQKMNQCGMRWHPSMIRVALAVYINSRSTYELLRDSGVIKLPSSRTLFDYSHPDVVKEGICASAIRDVAERVCAFQETYKKYHVLMADEMYTSKNLVFHKTSGELRGYMKLHDFDKEIKLMENFLDDPAKQYQPEMSSKILSFLLKGVCTDLKTVVATFAVSTVSVSQMYLWTWDIIGLLERSGVRVIAFTSDGSPTNRALIKMHVPVTQDKFRHGEEVIPGNAVYMTVNKAARCRNLYFICDVPHLLKTVRNCFNNSRNIRKKGKRRLKINGEVILWDTIIKLYNMKKDKMLRKSHKLNPQNVYPDSYSCMKVSLAAQVMSETVATDLEQQNWPGTRETVRFIRFINNWFDCLNGAHTYQGRRKRNERLDPYTDPNDARFQYLISFVHYLFEWKSQAERRSDGCDVSRMSSDSTLQGESVHDNVPHHYPTVVDDDVNDDTPAAQTQLSHQTLLGIETTVKSFISCTRFLLSEGCPFINARVFCQDPLEQHFGKLRSGFGGSTNPNASQCLNKQSTIQIMGQLGVKRTGNTEATEGAFQVTEDPLRKRKSVYSVSLDS